MMALLEGRCATAPRAFEPVVTDRGFRAAFDDETRAALLGGAAMCAMTGGDVKAAYAFARQGAAEPAADGAVWSVRLTLALANEAPEDALESFHVLAARFPKALAEVDDALVLATYQSLGARAKPDAARLRFLDALRASGWSPADPIDDATGFRLERTRLLLAARRVAEARAEAKALTDPFAVLALRIDDRFAAVRDDGAADPRAAARARLQRLTPLSASSPDRLSGPMAMAELHLMLGEPETALAVLDAALERRRRGGPSAFQDDGRHLNWVRDLRAQALFALGRWDDGLEAMAEAAGTPEDGTGNFSQAINLAGALTFLGRPEEAAAALDAIDDASLTDDGRAWVRAASACALAGRDPAGAAAAAAEADALGPSNFAARVHARLCLDDLDGAAALYRARLAQPEHRLEALLALQSYAVDAQTEATAPTGWGARRRAQMAALRARADIVEAVQRAGGRLETVALTDVHGRL